MGFPTWTLIGMGIAGLGATLFTLLTYVALSPDLLTRLPLVNVGLRRRVRELVGYNLACLFLAVGFFLAGVPLDGATEGGSAVVVITATPNPVTPTLPATVAPTEDISDLLELSDEVSADGTVESVTSGDSGAFGGPLQPADDEEAGAEDEAGDSGESETTPNAAAATNTPSPTPLPTATLTPSATPTPTATPTATPQPTQTAVPPLGDTAVVQTGGGTLWVRRTPGGETLAVVENGATVVLANGVANWEGTVWREVRTLDGVLGWVQNEFILLDE